MPRGFFLVFEGPEGSGKSSQIRHLAARLESDGMAPVITKEPGGTPVGEAIRATLLDPVLTLEPMTEFLLYSASRAELVRNVIKPGLAAGRLVIGDRFAGASVAYQGYGRGLDLTFIRCLTTEVTGGLQPDLTILLDLDVELGLARVSQRGIKDRLERAGLTFHERVREGFLEQAQADPRWTVVDASRSEEEVAEMVWKIIKEKVKLC